MCVCVCCVCVCWVLLIYVLGIISVKLHGLQSCNNSHYSYQSHRDLASLSITAQVSASFLSFYHTLSA